MTRNNSRARKVWRKDLTDQLRTLRISSFLVRPERDTQEHDLWEMDVVKSIISLKQGRPAKPGTDEA
jgi:hypothetical protein